MSTANKSSNRWLALMSATLAFTFTFLSRFTWAPLMSTVMEEFSINATQAGLYMSAFFAGYCITQIPGGIMADKLQPKYILMIATLLVIKAVTAKKHTGVFAEMAEADKVLYNK